MIADAVEFIRQELRAHLGVPDAEVVAQSTRTLVHRIGSSGAFIAVVKAQEEPVRRLHPKGHRPPMLLSIHLLFAFDFPTYPATLTHLSRTIELFQAKSHFSAATQTGPGATPFPPSVDSLDLVMDTLNFGELNHLWGMIGATYLPSVVYRVRVAQPDATAVLKA